MRYIVKGLIIASIVINMLFEPTLQYKMIIVLLLILSVTLLAGEFGRLWQNIFLVLETILILVAYFYLNMSLELMGILVFDAIYLRLYCFLAVLGGVAFWIGELTPLMHHFLLLSLCGIAAYMIRDSRDRGLYYREILDDERRMRYDLETIKNALVLSNQEIERLTEVKERNRIARDLHDTIGHSLAGIVIQLQAAHKIFERDPEKSKFILSQCVQKIQSALETVRNTVHNMYSKDKIGIDHINEIVTNYKYCKVDISYSGDFTEVPTKHMETLTFILKEALTNITKHSSASRIEVSVMVNHQLIRMQIHDNGKGFSVLHKGLGIKSMQDRISNLNGILSIDGSHGALIVCTIPLIKE